MTTLDQLREKFTQKEIEERISQINSAIELFKQYYREKKKTELIFIPDADIAIALKHFEWIDRFSKQFLEQGSLANAYKVASCTELAILLIKPIKSDNRAINVAFAIFCALNIIEGIRSPDHFVFQTGKYDLDKKLRGFEKDHANYLTILDITNDSTPPVNSNAAWWGLMHLFYMYKFQAV